MGFREQEEKDKAVIFVEALIYSILARRILSAEN